MVIIISAGGDAYFPMAATLDPSIEKVFDNRIIRNTDLILEASDSSYVNKEIFTKYIKENFINQVDAGRNIATWKESCHFI